MRSRGESDEDFCSTPINSRCFSEQVNSVLPTLALSGLRSLFYNRLRGSLQITLQQK